MWALTVRAEFKEVANVKAQRIEQLLLMPPAMQGKLTQLCISCCTCRLYKKKAQFGCGLGFSAGLQIFDLSPVSYTTNSNLRCKSK